MVLRPNFKSFTGKGINSLRGINSTVERKGYFMRFFGMGTPFLGAELLSMVVICGERGKETPICVHISTWFQLVPGLFVKN
jgi:hypothetical protein